MPHFKWDGACGQRLRILLDALGPSVALPPFLCIPEFLSNLGGLRSTNLFLPVIVQKVGEYACQPFPSIGARSFFLLLYFETLRNRFRMEIYAFSQYGIPGGFDRI